MPVAAPVSLFVLNAFVTLRLFHSEYIAHMDSIEAAFIGLARYIRDHFPHLSWMPLWYGGIPFPDAYPPLLHTIVAAASGVGHISAALAYHAVTAVFYSLGPVTLYWALRRMRASRWTAWIAAAGYSLLSPTLLLEPDFRRDIGSWLAPVRLDALLTWGEGPHVASLMLLALAMGAWWAAADRFPRATGKLRGSAPPMGTICFLAAVAVAATALTNWLGAFALALTAGAFALSSGATWLPIALVSVWAYAIAAPFFTPSTVATIQANAPLVASGGFKANGVLAAAFAVVAIALAWALARRRVDVQLRFAALFLYFTAGISLLADWFHLKVVPQPERYHLEMDLAFWLFAGLMLSRVRLVHRDIAIAVAAVLCVPLAVAQHRRAQTLERPIAIASTAEYEISRWLGAHDSGERVFAPGTIGFWMQAFSDTPMLNGGFDNGERNSLLPHVIFQIYAGEKQETMLAWAKAFGIGEIVGDWPQSREVYHPYAHPNKFAGLPEIWRDGPEVIYRVPRRRTSLAHALLPSDLPQVRPPAYDARPLDHYLAALDDPALPDAFFSWTNPDSAVISGSFTPQQVLSVQVTFDKGWRARVNNEPRPVMEDKLGQMIIAPHCNGPCTVNLFYDGGLEQQAARWLSIVALLSGLAIVVRDARRAWSPRHA